MAFARGRGLRDDSALRDELDALTPRLRRYARALTTGLAAPSDLADDLVHATLIRALGARQIGAHQDLVIRLYATVTQLNRELAVASREAKAAGAGHPSLAVAGRGFSASRPTRLSTAMMALSLEARESLLLVGLEGFDYAEASRILRISRGVLMSRLTQARSALDAMLRPESAPAGSAWDERRRQGEGGGRRGAHLRLVT